MGRVDSIKISIYFENEEITKANMIKWYQEMLFFKPTKIKGTHFEGGRTCKFHDNKFLKVVEEEINYEDFIIRLNDEDLNLLSLRHSKAFGAHIDMSITKELLPTAILDLLNIVDSFFIKHKGIVAFMCSSEDYVLQNANLNHYQWAGLPTDNLHLKQSHLNPNEKEVDTEYNPGHSHYPHDLWFGSCWAMWYGDSYFQYIPKEILKNFKNCHENKELEDGSVRILLYDDIWAFDTSDHRERQWSFRKQTGIDAIAHQLSNIPVIIHDADSSIELFNGNFEHGGVKKAKYFFDKNGQVVPKSKAIGYKTYEFDKIGKLVWTDEKLIV